MKIEFDPQKSQRNEYERGLPFHLAAELDWQRAIVRPDTRFNYPEPRFLALAFLGASLHVIVFTPISNGIRVISFRKANKREVKAYEQLNSLNQ